MTSLENKRGICISAEMGALIFAVINMIAATIASILSLGLFVYWAVFLTSAVSSRGGDDSQMMSALAYMMIVTECASGIVLMAFSFVAFLFAVLLIHGVIKKKSAYVKVYFVYGVVVTVLSVFGIVGYAVVTELYDLLTVAIAFIICFLYSLVLVMIHKTFKKFETITEQYSHQTLENKY